MAGLRRRAASRPSASRTIISSTGVVAQQLDHVDVARARQARPSRSAFSRRQRGAGAARQVAGAERLQLGALVDAVDPRRLLAHRLRLALGGEHQADGALADRREVAAGAAARPPTASAAARRRWPRSRTWVSALRAPAARLRAAIAGEVGDRWRRCAPCRRSPAAPRWRSGRGRAAPGSTGSSCRLRTRSGSPSDVLP